MGQALLDNLVPNLSRVRWPVDEAATELGRIAYEKGLELVDEFRGQPQKLVAALRTFTSADSRPYAFAGTAYTVMAAARESSGEYAPAGLKTAMEWLEAAQEMAPDIVSINFIEARIYVFEDRLEDARLVLDFLQEQDPNNYHVWATETLFWEHVGDEEKTIGAVVIGLPVHLDGRRGPEAEKALAFADALRRASGIEVDTLDERWTSKEAERLTQGMTKKKRRANREAGGIDEIAASIILRTFLDSRTAH